MQREIKITFNWWCNSQEITTEVEEILEERALKNIKDEWNNHMTSGDLHENLRMNESEPKFGVDYYGFWSLTTKNTTDLKEESPITYYLFGKQAVSSYEESGNVDQIISEEMPFEIIAFNPLETSGSELLSVGEGWESYTTISKEAFNLLEKEGSK